MYTQDNTSIYKYLQVQGEWKVETAVAFTSEDMCEKNDLEGTRKTEEHEGHKKTRDEHQRETE